MRGGRVSPVDPGEIAAGAGTGVAPWAAGDGVCRLSQWVTPKGCGRTGIGRTHKLFLQGSHHTWTGESIKDPHGSVITEEKVGTVYLPLGFFCHRALLLGNRLQQKVIMKPYSNWSCLPKWDELKQSTKRQKKKIPKRQEIKRKINLEYLDRLGLCFISEELSLWRKKRNSWESSAPNLPKLWDPVRLQNASPRHMSIDYNSSALWLKKLQDEESLTRVKQRQDPQPTVGRKTRSVELLSL